MKNKEKEINKLNEILESHVELKEKLEKKAKLVSDENGLNSFLENEIIPIAKKYNVKLTKEDLLNCTKESLTKINLEDLPRISGGISLKPFLMSGGILSAVMLCASMGSMQVSADKVSADRISSNTSVTSSSDNNANSVEEFENDKKDQQNDKKIDKLESSMGSMKVSADEISSDGTSEKDSQSNTSVTSSSDNNANSVEEFENDKQNDKKIDKLEDCFIDMEKYKEDDESNNWEKIVENLLKADKAGLELSSNNDRYSRAGINIENLKKVCKNTNLANKILQNIESKLDDYLYSPRIRLALSYMQEYFKNKGDSNLYLKLLNINKDIDKKIFLKYFKNMEKLEEDKSSGKKELNQVKNAKILKHLFALMQFSKQTFKYRDGFDHGLESVISPLCYGESIVFTLPKGMTEEDFLSALDAKKENFYVRASTHGIKHENNVAYEEKSHAQGGIQGVNGFLRYFTRGYVDSNIEDYCFDIDVNDFRKDKNMLDKSDISMLGKSDISRGHVLVVFRKGNDENPPAVLIKFEDAAPNKISPTNHYHGVFATSNHISLTNQIKETMPFVKREAFVGDLQEFEKGTLISYVKEAAQKLSPEELIGDQKTFNEKYVEKKANIFLSQKDRNVNYDNLQIPGVEVFRCVANGRTGFTYYGYLINNIEDFTKWCCDNNITEKQQNEIKSNAGKWLSTSKTGSLITSNTSVSNLGDNEFVKTINNIKNFFTDHAYQNYSKEIVTNIDVNVTNIPIEDGVLINKYMSLNSNKNNENNKKLFKNFVEDNFSIPGVNFARYEGSMTYYGFKIYDDNSFTKWCKDHEIGEEEQKYIKECQGKYLTTSMSSDFLNKASKAVNAVSSAAASLFPFWKSDTNTNNNDTITPDKTKGSAFWEKMNLIKNLFTHIGYENPTDIENPIVTNCKSEAEFNKAVK